MTKLPDKQTEAQELERRFKEIELDPPWPVSAERSGTKPVLYRPWLSSSELDRELSEFLVTRTKTPIGFALLQTYRKYWNSFDASLNADDPSGAIEAATKLKKLDPLLNLLPRNVVRSVNEAAALELAHVKARCLTIQQVRAIQESKGAPQKRYAIAALEMFLAGSKWHEVVMRFCDCDNPRHDSVEPFSERLLCDDRMRKCVKSIERELAQFPEMKPFLSKGRK